MKKRVIEKKMLEITLTKDDCKRLLETDNFLNLTQRNFIKDLENFVKYEK